MDHNGAMTSCPANRRLPLCLVLAWLLLAPMAQADRPADIVDVTAVIPDIRLDIRYATHHNFIGRRIPGYASATCLITKRAAEALGRVQQDLRPMGLGLKVYDCYRPQTAVDYFASWARDLNDQAMKAEFFPTVDKDVLFDEGYIAARSGHSRASTVDLTIVAMADHPPPAFDPRQPLSSCESAHAVRFPDTSIDMGTGYDCFSVRSHTLSPHVGAQQRANRLLLKSLMETHGFTNLPQEWWHYTLVDEPYPDTYFTFPVD